MNKFRILVIDDDKEWAQNTCDNLRTIRLVDIIGEGYDDRPYIKHVTNQRAASQAVVNKYDLVLLDLLYPNAPNKKTPEVSLGEFAGMRWLPELRRLQPNATIIILTAYPYENHLRNVVEAISRDHANDFVPKKAPFRDLLARIRLALAAQRRVQTLRMFEIEFHALLRSRAASVLASDVGRLIDHSNAELIDIAQNVESGDPCAIATAPGAIRGLCCVLREGYNKMSSFFATFGQERLRGVNLPKSVGQLLTLYAQRFAEAGAKTIAQTQDDGIVVTTYESDLRIALHELLWNAADALKDCKTPVAERKVEVKVAMDRVLKRAIVRVVDNGDGFSAEALAHIFEPRASTRRDDGHQGLGLYIAKHMMQAIGGSIQAKNSTKGGAEVVLTIPDLAK